MEIRKLSNVPLILMVSVFLTLDFTLLFLNLNLTQKLQNDAVIINLAGRQRMLSQRIAKSCLIDCTNRNPANRMRFTQTVRLADTFQQALTAFANGGYVYTAADDTVYIEAINDAESQLYIEQTFSLWGDVYATLKQWEADTYKPMDERSVRVVKAYATETNEDVLYLMNKLTVRSEEVSVTNAASLRQAQVVIFILVLLNFVAILYRFKRAGKEQDVFVNQLETLIHHLPQGILFIDGSHQVVYANSVSSKLFKMSVEELKLHTIEELLTTPLVEGSVMLNNKHIEIGISSVLSIPREVKMISLLDVTESITLKHKSSYDPLTQLLNRNGLIEAYTQLKSTSDYVCCLFLDLDKFKDVNDRYGHATGDLVLSVIAKRLKSCLKNADIVARFGGDEFVVLINEKLANDEITQLSERIHNAINEPIDIDHLIIELGVSIGVRIGYPNDESMEVIIDDADRAMYVNKNARG
ncbi:diguanylate cyclase [Vibrio hannami]|uniref:diguanylate cyclase domain-containing protein n=1 Tax=Vibrio hannami TaxID=2717094 RepID=UPI00240F60AD|nr:diguanylate cyclase [Vibrio hannami]MDG3085787.1 diguanylate cyclase [Vibrio hannami]